VHVLPGGADSTRRLPLRAMSPSPFRTANDEARTKETPHPLGKGPHRPLPGPRGERGPVDATREPAADEHPREPQPLTADPTGCCRSQQSANACPLWIASGCFPLGCMTIG
jgi:hypothetical protein